ncbi:MAG: hypothetical protein PHO92_04375 [Candidatus Peribacteraceae bacterium]|nr:hypothetical protein [Candidatus Peribacteraceae bacterium]
MAPLPASIESHLREVGFTATEILVLRHASDGQAFTVRQLAAKAGKSTGALDQAARKLLAKGILCREHINGSPKYTLASADAVARWVQEHTNEILSMLKRKEQDVRLYFSAMTLKQDRPRMEYFEGEEGIRKAYRQLLDFASDEFLVFLPLDAAGDSASLRDFQKSYVRERRRRGVKCRVLAHDTPLGRRYQSRDAFEERRTVLVPEGLYPFQCEQIIAGDTCTCFRPQEAKVCLMHFPSLAASQRALFEFIWEHYSVSNVFDTVQQGPAFSLESIPLAELECYPGLLPA